MEEDLIYDVGLHRGEDSAFYLAKGYKVVGFEANPDLAAECRARFAKELRMRVVEGAITDSPTPTVRFFRHRNSIWGTTHPDWAKRNAVVANSEPIDVASISLATILAETGVPLYMKIDIEGADLLCLHALLQLKEAPKYISLESSKTNWHELTAEFSALERLGYSRFAVVQQATIPGTQIVTTTIDGRPLRFRFEPNASGPFGPDLPNWTDRASAEQQYRRLFRAYRFWGDDAPVRKTKLGRALVGKINRYIRPLPGWFDTHAAK